MRDKVQSKLSGILACQFVLWDSGRGRGWLVGGDTVALHLFRMHLTYLPGAASFDFNSLKGLGDSASSAYDVLTDPDNLDRAITSEGAGKSATPDNGQSTKDKDKDKDKDELKPVKFFEVLGGICDVLLEINEQAITVNDHNGVSGPIHTWYDRHWAVAVRGWDFHNIASNKLATVRVCELHKDPGWLKMIRDLRTPFLFVKGMGEILKPKDGSCCRYFESLPSGKNLLASNMTVLGRLINHYGGDDVDNLPEKTLARLSQTQCWKRGLNPFAHPNCRGDHLDTLDPTCFPVQGFQTAPLHPTDDQKNVKQDIKYLKKNPNLYTKGEILKMVRENPNGVVVFGRQPNSEEMRDMYLQSQQDGQAGTQNTASAPSTSAQLSNRPSSRGSGLNSIQPSAPAPESPTAPGRRNGRPNASSEHAKGSMTPTEAPREPSGTSDQRRTPSVTSIKSTDSSDSRRARAAGPGTDGTSASTPQASTSAVHQVASNSSLRSTASSTRPSAPGTTTDAGQARTTSLRQLAMSTHKTASNASLRSNGSAARPQPTVSGSGRPEALSSEPSAATATRKASNSSVRTTSSAGSTGPGGSQPGVPAAEAPTLALKKTSTNSSNRTTSSRSSGSPQTSGAESSAAENRQRQQRRADQGAVTAAATVTQRHRPIPSGPSHMGGGGGADGPN